MYEKNVQGIIYKKFLKYLVFGLLGVISTSIFTQALASLGSVRLLGVSLSWLLFLVYVLLGIMVIGYGFIAYGAKKLTLIEKVT